VLHPLPRQASTTARPMSSACAGSVSSKITREPYRTAAGWRWCG